MNSEKKEIERLDRKVVLSTVWIFVTVNYIFCDVLSNMSPEFLRELIEGGELLGLPVDQKFLFWSAVFMEIPFVMILLSRVLKYRANRSANIIAATIMTVAQTASLFVGPPELHYMFYSTLEIGCTLFIIWYALKWRRSEEGLENRIINS